MNFLISKIISISLLVILFTANGISKEKNTPFFMSFGADVNANIYFADFKQFEGVDNCCTNFGNTTGLGYNVHAGFEYLFPSKLLGMPWRLDLSIAYSDLSAAFSEEYEIANIIQGNTYTKAVSEFILEPSIQAVIFDPGIFFNPIDDVPLSIRAGFQVGFLTGKTFTQEEKLVSPPNVYFENGTRVRGQFSGEIPNASSQYFALSIGARYKAADFGNFALYPQLRFNYGLTDIVNGLDWKASALQGGLSLVYNFPGKELPPPAEPPSPPMPDAPVPPKKGQLVLGITTEHNDAFVGNTIDIPYIHYESRIDYYLLPYIFFDLNSDRPITAKSSANNIGEVEAQSEMIKSAAEYLAANPGINVNLMVSSLESEKQEVIDSRITNITNELTYFNVPINRINVNRITVNPNDFEHDELLKENIFIKLEMSDKTDLIHHLFTQTIKKETIGTNTLKIKPEIQTSHSLSAFDGKLYKDKNLIKSFNDLGTEINLNNTQELIAEEFSPYTINIEITAKNTGGAKEIAAKTIEVNSFEERRITENNIFKEDINDYSQYLLCYFDFDKHEPKTINREVLDIVRTALNQDKEVVLLALTDNIGTEKYNNELAQRRGNAGLQLIGSKEKKINVVIPEKHIFGNDTPIGRMLNRTVIVRIKN